MKRSTPVLPAAWYTRAVVICVLCAVLSVANTVRQGGFAGIVVNNEKHIRENAKGVAQAKTAIPKAKAAAAVVAKREARRVLVVNRRSVQRYTRTVVRREIGRRGAMGRPGVGLPPTHQVIVDALAGLMPAALSEYCTAHGCEVRPTLGQVTAALESFCSDGSGRCTISQAEIDSALASYCEGPGKPCKGEKGADGKDGRDGIDGAPAPPNPLLPCAMQDVALGYQCVPSEPPPPVGP